MRFLCTYLSERTKIPSKFIYMISVESMMPTFARRQHLTENFPSKIRYCGTCFEIRALTFDARGGTTESSNSSCHECSNSLCLASSLRVATLPALLSGMTMTNNHKQKIQFQDVLEIYQPAADNLSHTKTVVTVEDYDKQRKRRSTNLLLAMLRQGSVHRRR